MEEKRYWVREAAFPTRQPFEVGQQWVDKYGNNPKFIVSDTKEGKKVPPVVKKKQQDLKDVEVADNENIVGLLSNNANSVLTLLRKSEYPKDIYGSLFEHENEHGKRTSVLKWLENKLAG